MKLLLTFIISGVIHICGLVTTDTNSTFGVQVPNSQYKVSIADTSGTQRRYTSDRDLDIYGSNFNPQGNNLRFANRLLGDGANYTMIHSTEKQLYLRLTPNSQWIRANNHQFPVNLTLLAINVGQGFIPACTSLCPEDINGHNQGVNVATIFLPPAVVTPAQVPSLNCTESRTLRIYGHGFTTAPYRTRLRFKTSLIENVDYFLQFASSEELLLTLFDDRNWCATTGPLYVEAINTLGYADDLIGWVRFTSSILVANVVEDVASVVPLPQTVVFDTSEAQVVYATDTFLTITGQDFNAMGNILYFNNGLQGGGVNYTVATTTSTSIQLRLVPGSYWYAPYDLLPSYLTVFAINAGEGAIIQQKHVATILEPPGVYSAAVTLLAGVPNELQITGHGFTTAADTRLQFYPALIPNVDYTLRVVSRNTLLLSLNISRLWLAVNLADGEQSVPLFVEAVTTMGSRSGWVHFPGRGVQVATVKDIPLKDDLGSFDGDDFNSSKCLVTITSRDIKVYQSVQQSSIAVGGHGFRSSALVGNLTFELDPPLQAGLDYDLDILTDSNVRLTLRPKKYWRRDAGPVYIKWYNINLHRCMMEKVLIAHVLPYPVVVHSDSQILHESQTHLLEVHGQGICDGFFNQKTAQPFDSIAHTLVYLLPTSIFSYQLLPAAQQRKCVNQTLLIQLMTGQKWLPSFLTLRDDTFTRRVPLQLRSIDTGAGPVEFQEPIVVASVMRDIWLPPGGKCEDSCITAFNGICEDPTSLARLFEDGHRPALSQPNNSTCGVFTDCTDCGGIDQLFEIIAAGTPTMSPTTTVCDNTCIYPRDGVCDDTRGTKYCALGTDCQDCGPIGAANFSNPGEFLPDDDDDDYWTFNDGSFSNGGGSSPITPLHPTRHHHNEPSTFVRVFETLAYVIVAVAGLILIGYFARRAYLKHILKTSSAAVWTSSSSSSTALPQFPSAASLSSASASVSASRSTPAATNSTIRKTGMRSFAASFLAAMPLSGVRKQQQQQPPQHQADNAMDDDDEGLDGMDMPTVGRSGQSRSGHRKLQQYQALSGEDHEEDEEAGGDQRL